MHASKSKAMQNLQDRRLSTRIHMRAHRHPKHNPALSSGWPSPLVQMLHAFVESAHSFPHFCRVIQFRYRGHLLWLRYLRWCKQRVALIALECHAAASIQRMIRRFLARIFVERTHAAMYAGAIALQVRSICAMFVLIPLAVVLPCVLVVNCVWSHCHTVTVA